MTAYCGVIVILMVAVRHSDGGCHVSDWPHSCQMNFRMGPQRCEPCESGSYGCNCSERCPNGYYGQGCYHVCDCSDEQFCDPVVGCTNIGTTKGKITVAVKYKVKSTAHVEGYTIDVTNTPSLKTDIDQLTILTVVGITMSTLLSIGVLSNVVCFLFLCRRKSGSVTHGKVNQDLKSTEGVLELGTSAENIDVHSYLTISDRSVRLYAVVHYDEVEEGKSSPLLSLHKEKEDKSIESKMSPSLSLHSKKEENRSIKSDTSKLSQGYLTPVVTTVEETKSGSHRSID